MRSTPEQMEDRGFIPENHEDRLIGTSSSGLLTLLHSQSAVERSSAARLLAKEGNPKSIEDLCFALEKEKKLYTKIELCNALTVFGEPAIPGLVPLLGKIGNNQHKCVSSENFKKVSYPLPRDIVARILIRIGSKSLPYLAEVLASGNPSQISEATDAIGFISFYEKDNRCYENLLRCYENNRSNDLIIWKIARAMSAFPASVEFLNRLLQSTENRSIKQEIKRSLQLITDRG